MSVCITQKLCLESGSYFNTLCMVQFSKVFQTGIFVENTLKLYSRVMKRFKTINLEMGWGGSEKTK